jgi:hypothetical protein
MVGNVVLYGLVSHGHRPISTGISYMKSALIEKYVMLFMVGLQQLARLFGTLSRQPFDVELRLLRSLEVHSRPSSHGSQ